MKGRQPMHPHPPPPPPPPVSRHAGHSLPRVRRLQQVLGRANLGWVQGENKLLHWRTLLCARAIENGLTVFGADQYAPGKFVGHSMAFQPDGTALGELGEEQDLLIVKIN